MQAVPVSDNLRAAQHVEAAKPASALRLYHFDGCRFCLPFAVGDTAASQMLEDFAARLTAVPHVACRGVSVSARPTIGAASLLPSAADHMQTVRAAASAAQSAADAGPGWALHDTGRDAAQQRVFTLLSALDLLLADATIKANGSFRLVWQPRIELSTSRCVAAEGLLRWRHPTLGEISPGEFIPLSEGKALMPRLTDLVLATALAQMRRWQDASLRLETASVNISAGDLEDDALAGRVERALAAAGVAPGALELEFTETAVMEPDRLQRRLAAVRELGVGIALDDFDAGYSNLTYLRRVPATTVKLDRELVATAAHTARDRTVAEATVSMLRELGLRVVAEGIETEADAATMRESGCDEGQGYLFSPPFEAEAFETWLRTTTTVKRSRN